ncbi:hypothetical protein [Asticcacaulis sp. EMRT-3]|uniref:hypothetical protein n=1 Tax=Asticcacaulis sp. EMRT-3 TaxID=3040349 RepID=UPI0024AF30AB|nr:hypothetical protein [Asticcacaulis sp. EMRT-3]MDI7775433.1 hypothetical protein [Asticcacaulis sp. EMRT-3]
MLLASLVSGTLFCVTFTIYYAGLRAGWRWTAWPVAALFASAGFLIQYLGSGLINTAWRLDSLILLMVVISLPVRHRFGPQRGGHSVYRQHRLKRR